METVVSKEEEEEAVVVENGRKMKTKKRCTWLQTRRKKWRRSKRWHTASAGGMGVRVGGKVREERVEDGEESAVVVVAKEGVDTAVWGEETWRDVRTAGERWMLTRCMRFSWPCTDPSPVSRSLLRLKLSKPLPSPTVAE